jgi:hypothetical protein
MELSSNKQSFLICSSFFLECDYRITPFASTWTLSLSKDLLAVFPIMIFLRTLILLGLSSTEDELMMHVTRTEETGNSDEILIGKHKGKRPVWRIKRGMI